MVKICDSENIQILKGVVSKGHVHVRFEHLPILCMSILVKKLKGHSPRMLQKEFSPLGKTYWGLHFWAVGHGAWSTGKITDEIVQEYLKHHKDKSDSERGNWMVE